MRSVAFSEFGGADVLEMRDLPQPEPGPQQVRIRVSAATVNPTDTIFRSGLQYASSVKRPPPWIPGMDFAGVIDLPGPDSRWSEGVRVMGVAIPSGSRQGAYADYVVVSDDSVAELPDHVDLAGASTVPMNGLTALRALDQIEEIAGHGLTVGVTGAAGGVGGLFIQMARRRGHRIIADASERDREMVKGLGADVVLGRGPGWPLGVRERGGVDALLDAGVTGDSAAQCVRPGGVLALVRSSDGAASERIHVINTQMTDYYRREGKLSQLAEWVADGTLALRIAAVLPPEQAADAHRRLEGGGTRGRLVLDFSDGATQR